MTRAAFNTTCDIYEGPGGSSPGSLIGTFDCRFVIADSINMVGVGAINPIGWITLDGVEPVGVWTNPGWGVDPGLANQIAVPSGSSPSLWVFWVEEIIHGSQSPYYRATVGALPLPSAPPDGLTCTSAVPTNTNVVETFTAIPSPGEKWWVLTMSPGSWIIDFIVDNINGGVEVFEGDCSGLTLITGGLGTNILPFTIPAGPDLVIHVKVTNNFAGVDINGSWEIS